MKDLTESEMAKSHVRYMVGGKAPSHTEEQIFRVQFPEKPGALYTFLTHLGGRFNITMFHYRNHGSAFGKVLVGFQCSDSDCKLIKKIRLSKCDFKIIFNNNSMRSKYRF